MNGEDDILGGSSGEDVPASDDAADKAFKAAKTGFELFDDPLRPYSPSRKVAAQSMGLLYPYIGEAGAEQMSLTGMYPGSLKDTIIVLWLCSLKDASEQSKDEIKEGQWNPSRANAKPQLALESAINWAGEKGIVEINSPAFEEAFQVFIAIVSGVAVSEFELKLSSREPDEPDTGPKT